MTAIKLYRIAHKLYQKHIPLLPKIFYRLIYFINNSHLHYETEVGEGTTLAYGGWELLFIRMRLLVKIALLNPM